MFVKRSCICVGVVLGCLISSSARGGLINNVATGLAVTNFDVQGQHNILSGGSDLLINNNFRGNPLDFGFGDLTLQGPVSLDVSTGRRFLPTLDISFSTAIDGDSQAIPLQYSLTADVGGQATQVSGSLLVDASLSVNRFGFYDVNLNYSSRQQVDSDGRFSNGSENFDFDAGPISVSGNIFADVLAFITNPLFESTGTLNIFESFSGAAALKGILDGQDSVTISRLSNGESIIDGPLADVAIDRRGFNDRSLEGAVFSVVPEPGVLVLLLTALPVLWFKSFKRRSV